MIRVRYLGHPVLGDEYHGSDGLKSLDIRKDEERDVEDETAGELIETWPESWAIVTDGTPPELPDPPEAEPQTEEPDPEPEPKSEPFRTKRKGKKKVFHSRKKIARRKRG